MQSEKFLSYGILEEAIAKVLKVDSKGRPALNARLRHIRSRGALPRPGSGKKIRYSRSQAFEMLIIVILEHGGFTPRVAMAAANDIYGASLQAGYEDVFAVLVTTSCVPKNEEQEDRLVYGHFVRGENELLEAMRMFRAAFILNVSAIANDFAQVLEVLART
jgi:hypothetical protein